MSTLRNLHQQARRSKRPAFTLLELIVVLLVLGILAAIAVPTFAKVKENAVARVVQTTLETIDRNGEAIAVSDYAMSDIEIATAVVAEMTPRAGMTITCDGAVITVEYTNASATATGSVTFSGGVGTLADAGVAGGGGGGGGGAAPAFMLLGSDIDGEAAGDRSGISVAMSSDGSTVAIGANGNSSYAGHVRVYTWNGSSWTQRGSDINGEAVGDDSGSSVAMSSDGDTVAIGASGNDGNGSQAGHVRVYTWNGSSWTQRGSDINGEAGGDLSGGSVAMAADGSTVAIGASGNDGNGSQAGHVRVYTWNGSSWVKRGSDIDGEAASDRSGSSVALSADGDTVAIGAYGNDGNGSQAGHVRVYAWNGSSWVKRGADIDGDAADDRSGSSVALSSDGSTVAIGASGNDGNGSQAGHVRVYAWNGSSWTQRGSDIDGEAAGDWSGSSVAMSSDGAEVAIGASSNGSTGTNAGHVRVYAWNGSSWTQRGSDIDGDAADDQSGGSVALSGDGAEVAIGAKGNSGNGSQAGHVRVYAWS
jgi:prepilin-type N-terminal cleavage/methylation domain-containing protein